MKHSHEQDRNNKQSTVPSHVQEMLILLMMRRQKPKRAKHKGIGQQSICKKLNISRNSNKKYILPWGRWWAWNQIIQMYPPQSKQIKKKYLLRTFVYRIQNKNNFNTVLQQNMLKQNVAIQVHVKANTLVLNEI